MVDYLRWTADAFKKKSENDLRELFKVFQENARDNYGELCSKCSKEALGIMIACFLQNFHKLILYLSPEIYLGTVNKLASVINASKEGTKLEGFLVDLVLLILSKDRTCAEAKGTPDWATLVAALPTCKISMSFEQLPASVFEFSICKPHEDNKLLLLDYFLEQSANNLRFHIACCQNLCQIYKILRDPKTFFQEKEEAKFLEDMDKWFKRRRDLSDFKGIIKELIKFCGCIADDFGNTALIQRIIELAIKTIFCNLLNVKYNKPDYLEVFRFAIDPGMGLGDSYKINLKDLLVSSWKSNLGNSWEVLTRFLEAFGELVEKKDDKTFFSKIDEDKGLRFFDGVLFEKTSEKLFPKQLAKEPLTNEKLLRIEKILEIFLQAKDVPYETHEKFVTRYFSDFMVRQDSDALSSATRRRYSAGVIKNMSRPDTWIRDLIQSIDELQRSPQDLIFMKVNFLYSVHQIAEGLESQEKKRLFEKTLKDFLASLNGAQFEKALVRLPVECLGFSLDMNKELRFRSKPDFFEIIKQLNESGRKAQASNKDVYYQNIEKILERHINFLSDLGDLKTEECSARLANFLLAEFEPSKSLWEKIIKADRLSSTANGTDQVHRFYLDYLSVYFSIPGVEELEKLGLPVEEEVLGLRKSTEVIKLEFSKGLKWPLEFLRNISQFLLIPLRVSHKDYKEKLENNPLLEENYNLLSRLSNRNKDYFKNHILKLEELKEFFCRKETKKGQLMTLLEFIEEQKWNGLMLIKKERMEFIDRTRSLQENFAAQSRRTLTVHEFLQEENLFLETAEILASMKKSRILAGNLNYFSKDFQFDVVGSLKDLITQFKNNLLNLMATRFAILQKPSELSPRKLIEGFLFDIRYDLKHFEEVAHEAEVILNNMVKDEMQRRGLLKLVKLFLPQAEAPEGKLLINFKVYNSWCAVLKLGEAIEEAQVRDWLKAKEIDIKSSLENLDMDAFDYLAKLDEAENILMSLAPLENDIQSLCTIYKAGTDDEIDKLEENHIEMLLEDFSLAEALRHKDYVKTLLHDLRGVSGYEKLFPFLVKRMDANAVSIIGIWRDSLHKFDKIKSLLSGSKVRAGLIGRFFKGTKFEIYKEENAFKGKALIPNEPYKEEKSMDRLLLERENCLIFRGKEKYSNFIAVVSELESLLKIVNETNKNGLSSELTSKHLSLEIYSDKEPTITAIEKAKASLTALLEVHKKFLIKMQVEEAPFLYLHGRQVEKLYELIFGGKKLPEAKLNAALNLLSYNIRTIVDRQALEKILLEKSQKKFASAGISDGTKMCRPVSEFLKHMMTKLGTRTGGTSWACLPEEHSRDFFKQPLSFIQIDPNQFTKTIGALYWKYCQINPSASQILVCKKATKLGEVQAFMNRVFYGHVRRGMFTVIVCDDGFRGRRKVVDFIKMYLEEFFKSKQRASALTNKITFIFFAHNHELISFFYNSELLRKEIKKLALSELCLAFDLMESALKFQAAVAPNAPRFAVKLYLSQKESYSDSTCGTGKTHFIRSLSKLEKHYYYLPLNGKVNLEALVMHLLSRDLDGVKHMHIDIVQIDASSVFETVFFLLSLIYFDFILSGEEVFRRPSRLELISLECSYQANSLLDLDKIFTKGVMPPPSKSYVPRDVENNKTRAPLSELGALMNPSNFQAIMKLNYYQRKAFYLSILKVYKKLKKIFEERRTEEYNRRLIVNELIANELKLARLEFSELLHRQTKVKSQIEDFLNDVKPKPGESQSSTEPKYDCSKIWSDGNIFVPVFFATESAQTRLRLLQDNEAMIPLNLMEFLVDVYKNDNRSNFFL